MAELDKETIDTITKIRYGDSIKETVKNSTLLLREIKQLRVSNKATTPINLAPGDSMGYNKNIHTKNEYPGNIEPVMKLVEAELMNAFFKIEIPMGTISSLKTANTDKNLAYSTAEYFIEDQIRKNYLLLELLILYGDKMFPELVALTGAYQGKDVNATNFPDVLNPFAVTFDLNTTSIGITQIVKNSRVTIGDLPQTFHVVDVNGSEMLLSATESSQVPTNTQVSGKQMYHSNIKGNALTSIYNILNDTGTVLGINGDVNLNWNATKVDGNNGRLTSDMLRNLATQISSQTNMMNLDVTAYMSHKSWDSIAEEFDAGVRLVDSSYKSSKLEIGHRQIGFYHSTGEVKFVVHPLMRNDTLFMLSNPKHKDNFQLLVSEYLDEKKENKSWQLSENKTAAYTVELINLGLITRARNAHGIITNLQN